MKKTWTTRALAMLLLTITFVAAFCGCSSTKNNITTNSTPYFSEKGYIIGPGGFTCTVESPDMTFSYTTLTDDQYNKAEFDKKASEYIELVRKWWNNDQTFVAPNGIIAVRFQNGPRGFAEDGYIFVEPFKEDSFITVLHEGIHLQNPQGLRDSEDNGKALNEMLVEDITKRILGKNFFGIPTDEQRFFKSCPNLVEHRETLESAFKNKESAEQVYSEIFGPDWKHITGLLNSWRNLPYMMEKSSLDFFAKTYLGVAPTQLHEIYFEIQLENEEYSSNHIEG